MSIDFSWSNERISDFRGDGKASIPDDMPKPLGNVISTNSFVDVACNRVTHRFNSALFIVQWANWYFETSSLGIDFITLDNAVELFERLWYKIWTSS